MVAISKLWQIGLSIFLGPFGLADLDRPSHISNRIDMLVVPTPSFSFASPMATWEICLCHQNHRYEAKLGATIAASAKDKTPRGTTTGQVASDPLLRHYLRLPSWPGLRRGSPTRSAMKALPVSPLLPSAALHPEPQGRI